MQVEVRHQLEDPEWDAFVGAHPYGHHEQTAAFARVRAQSRFACLRVLLRSDDEILAGAQVLYRRYPFVGGVALCSQGPVVDPDDGFLCEALFDAMDAAARAERFVRLRVISYAAQSRLSALLESRGFNPSGYRWAPRETSLVDLRESEPEILSRMHRKGRYNIKVAVRKQVEVHAAGADELPVFHSLLCETARRQDFPVLPLEYFRGIWDQFAPADKLQLWIATHAGEPLAALLVTVWGDRASYGWGGQSDAERNRMPNYLLHWTAIRWARDRGLRQYCLAGVSDDPNDGVSAFKRKLGQVTRFPDPCDRYYGHLAQLHRGVLEAAWDQPRLQDLVENVSYRLYGGLAF